MVDKLYFISKNGSLGIYYGCNLSTMAEVFGWVGLPRKLASRLTAYQKQLISFVRGLMRFEVVAVLMDEPLTVIDPDLKFCFCR